MLNLLLLLRDIVQLRRGPQDIPYSSALLAAVCVVSLALQLAIADMIGIAGNTFGAGAIGIVIDLGMVYFVVMLRGFASRFVQTATALECCKIIFSIVTLPILFVVAQHPIAPGQATPMQALLGLISLPILIWKVVVDAHILRHSLALSFAGGALAAILLIVAEYMVGLALSVPASGS